MPEEFTSQIADEDYQSPAYGVKRGRINTSLDIVV